MILLAGGWSKDKGFARQLVTNELPVEQQKIDVSKTARAAAKQVTGLLAAVGWSSKRNAACFRVYKAKT